MKQRLLYITFFYLVKNIFPQVPDSSLWITNGPVNTVAKSGDSLYIGGMFDYVGKSSGYGVIADTVIKNIPPGFPKINGPVYTVTPDHRGGWYIGGRFSRVGGHTRNNIARINKDGTVNVDFDPNIEGAVYTIATSLKKGANQYVFVGGSFYSINTYPCNNIAAVSPNTGKPYPWLPKVNGTIRTICIYSRDDSNPRPGVYIGGDFNTIDVAYTAYVQNIALLGYPDSASYTVTLGSWNPLADKTVRCIFGWKKYILVGGDFSKIGNRFWSYFAAIDSTGNTANLNFAVNGPVYSITGSRYITPLLNDNPPFPPYPPLPPYNTLSPSVYIVGAFTSVMNQARNRFAEIIPDKLKLTALTIPADDKITTAFPSLTGKIYFGGNFHTIGGKPRDYFAEFDTSSKQITNWTLNLSNGINSLALAEDKLFIGGNFNSRDGVKRKNLAVIDLTTGHATGFNPDVNDVVNTMIIHNDVLYLSGNFTKVNNNSRNKLAAFDLNTELVNTWNLSTDGTVRTMVADGNNLFLAGYFSKAGTENRNNIVCYLLDSARISKKWNPDVNGTINSVLLLNNKLYIGGYFTRVGNYIRNYLASVELNKSVATGWNPDADAGVYTLSSAGDKIYAGGWFSSIGGNGIGELASIDTLTGITDAGFGMKFNVNSYVKFSEASGDKLYVAGDFFDINGQSKNKFSEIDIGTQNPGTWDPKLYNHNGIFGVNMIKIIDNSLYIGGSFNNSGEFIQSYLAVYPGLVTGIRKEEKQNPMTGSLRIYPNPAREFIQMEVKDVHSSVLNLKINDLTGRVVYILTAKSSEIFSRPIPVSTLPPGMYILEIEDGKNHFISKFIKN